MKTLSFFSICLFLSLTLTAQKVITVDNRLNTGPDVPNVHYSSLSDAVGVAIVGDTIQIHPSATAYGNVTVNKRLILVGLSHNPDNSKVGEKATVGLIYFTGQSANSLVTGLQISGITNTGTLTDLTGIKITNNRISSYISVPSNAALNGWTVEGNIFTNAYVNLGTLTNNWMIKNNIFDQTTQYPIHSCNDQTSFLNNLIVSSSGNFANNCTDTIVSNNIFILEGSITDVKLNGSTIVYSNNLTRNTSGFTVTSLSGSGNLDNTDPGFSFAFADIADYYNNDYNVSGPAVGAGTDGTDLGVYGAMFNFDPQGRPDLWPYMTSLDISNPSVPMGQNINVTFTAGKKN